MTNKINKQLANEMMMGKSAVEERDKEIARLLENTVMQHYEESDSEKLHYKVLENIIESLKN